MIDSQVHITRRAGPTSAESFAHTAIKWLRFHDAIAQTTPDSPFDVYLIEFLRKQLNRLSPARPKRHWRDDSALMSFLAKL